MDYDRARHEVEQYISLLDGSWMLFQKARSSQEYKVSYDEAVKGVSLIVKFGNRLQPGFSEGLQVHTSGWPFAQVRLRALELAGMLRDARKAEEIIGPTGPQLAAANLHPVVWQAAAQLWDSGYPRQAVETAASTVDTWLGARLGRDDLHGTDLVQQAFTAEAPAPGKPRLRFLDVAEGTPRWKNEHIGTMNFGIGCMMLIRNLVSHDPEGIDPQVALEQLAALSVLARQIERADRIEADDESAQ